MMHGETNPEGLELFFTTFVDEDLNDDINLLTWIKSLKKMSFDKDMTEKEMIHIFYFIDCDRTGYIDCVDFVNFCLQNHAKALNEITTKYISKLHTILLENIESHPFVIS